MAVAVAGFGWRRRRRKCCVYLVGAERVGSAALRSFVAGLRANLDAVTAGLTLPHSAGLVEGTINPITM